MLLSMPVQNCMHFMAPVSLEHWRAYDVPGIVGVLKREDNGQYSVIDAFEVDAVPTVRQLALDERFGSWTDLAGSRDKVRFDVFLMPKADMNRRKEVVTLLERSCGFKATQIPAYAHAV
ncbi:MAG: hypothetical protein J0I17_08100 ['Candidatus Kapabacteria' thiocyanatum]|nr:hypothetical protein ['Candidatus Kapabacteria' thiocyanatum]